MADYPALLKKIKAELSNGDIPQAVNLMNEVRIGQVDTTLRAQYSHLARRLDLPDLALKFIWENVFVYSNPSQEDILQCAHTFRRLGVNGQAIKLLEQLPLNSERQMALAFSEISQWKYTAAQKHLEQCLDFNDLSQFQQDVAQVNLAACLIVNEDIDLALKILTNLQSSGLEARNSILHHSCQELKIQAFAEQEEFESAFRLLAQFQQVELKPLARLFFDKWKLFCELLSKKVSADDPKVETFQQQVRQMKHWETLRHLDYIIAKCTGAPEKINHVFFGTPHDSFRQKITRISPPWPSYLWYDRRHPLPSIKAYDSYQLDNKNLKYGLANHRLFLLLASDFYAPYSVEQIFDRLFSDEVFNPETSRRRIHQLIAKLRQSLESAGIDVQLDATENGYRLRPLGSQGFRVYRDMVFSSQEELLLATIRQTTSDTEFNKQQLMGIVDLGKDQLYRAVKKLSESGQLKITGSGRNQKYKLVS